MRASSLVGDGAGADEGDRSRCRPAAARSSTQLGTPLAIGEQATDVYADPHADHAIRAREARDRRQRARAEARHRVRGALRPQHAASSTSRGKASPKLAACSRSGTSPGFAFDAEERRSYPQGTVAAQVLGYAGVDNTGSSGLELAARPASSTGTPGRADRRPRRARPACDTIQQRPGRATAATSSSRSTAHIQANAEQVLERHGAQVAREGRDGDRARSADGRRARDGAGAGLRRERLPGGDRARPDGRPRGERRLRAGLGVQGRDDRRRALRARLVTPKTTFRCRTRSRSPTASIHDAEPRGTETHDGRADPPALVERRRGSTIARALARRDAA